MEAHGSIRAPDWLFRSSGMLLKDSPALVKILKKLSGGWLAPRRPDLAVGKYGYHKFDCINAQGMTEGAIWFGYSGRRCSYVNTIWHGPGAAALCC